MTSQLRFSACWLLIVILLANGEAHAVAAEDLPSSVRVEEGRVDITLAATENQNALSAKIRVSMLLKNATEQRDKVQRIFSIAAPSTMGVRQFKKNRCRVTVNDIPVKFETKNVVDRTEEIRTWPNREQAITWRKRLEDWFAQDQELSALIAQYRRLASVQTEMGQLTETFKERVKGHLIHKDLEHAALEVANGGPYFGHLVNLMTEIEPAYRIDGKFHRWEYVSLLSDGNPEVYRPYEKEWREKADQWFMSKPDLALIVPRLRELWKSFREAQQLLAGPILKYLHDVNGLSLPVADQLQSFIAMGDRMPSTELMRMMFPDIDAELKKQSTAVSMRLRERGFDESVVSPFTGMLMPFSSMPRPFERTFAKDETVLVELGRPKKTTAFVQNHREPPIAPMLILFEAPLDPKSEVAVVIEYDTDVLPLQNPMASNVMFAAAEEIIAVFPSPGDVPFSVTCPTAFQPIIAPGPRGVASLEDGVRRFEGLLNGEHSAVHIAVVNIASDVSSWTSRFSRRDDQLLNDLGVLIDRIDNPSVRPLLMTSKYVSLLQSGRLWDAHEFSLQIRVDHTDFAGLLDSLSGNLYQAVEAKQLYEWVAQKANSPSLNTDEDLNRFKVQSGNSIRHLTPAHLKVLADRVGKLNADSLSLREKMGRHFILCQAGVDTEENLRALLHLAEANPREAISSLKLIQFMTIEKSSALSYVIRQIDLDLREKVRSGKLEADSFEWTRQNSAYHAMGTFRSPECAKQLIEFIHSTDDSLLVQGVMDALGHMTLPGHFEELTGIADRIAASSESAYIKYLALLLRSDLDRAVPFLEALPTRHPEFAGNVLRALGEWRVPMALSRALDIYRSSSDEDQLRVAVSVIGYMAEPKDIAALEYRKGLPMNGGLVSVIRTKGGDQSVFPFVEAYYKEFVRGKENFEHLDCVGAFEQIGDPRAIPYLREIFNSTERKRDAAQAIGRLILDRQMKRREVVNDSIDEHILAITKPNESEEKRAAALKELLLTPEKSFDRVMVYSRVRIALEATSSEWDEEDDAGCRFISSFGDVAAVRLLKESDGCSLHRRYRIAHLLTLLLPSSRELIEEAANDKSADEDRRRTAQLALTLIGKSAGG